MLNEVVGPVQWLMLDLFPFQRHLTTTRSMENQPNLSSTPHTDDDIDLRQVFGQHKVLIAGIQLQVF